jgi:site-specific DNA-methyltransferase (adenine-specific)
LALHLGDCLEVMRTLPDASVDAVVTDPPYGLAFMGKRWDYDVPTTEVWAECLRVLKPGGHLLAFAGTRTQHRMAVRIEDAGFEIRDMIAWVYGSGFPKSLDVSKAIDRAAGAEREVVGSRKLTGTARIKGQAAYGATSGRSEEAYRDGSEISDTLSITAPATPEARQWTGWGTALKPALEPITMARKPLEGTVAANVLAHGTGGINVDGCRVEGQWSTWKKKDGTVSEQNQDSHAIYGQGMGDVRNPEHPSSRWPANLIHDGSDEVVGLFPSPHGAGKARQSAEGTHSGPSGMFGIGEPAMRFGDSGSAARFFYTAKASRDDRSDGNTHPTVKPTDLMRYLCRLVTPPGGVVLDPFMGSGSTGKAAMLEGFCFIGIEREAAYHAIAKRRIHQAGAAGHQPDLFTSALAA